jgi:hypothetical protein
MNDPFLETRRPGNVGDDSNLPPDLRALADLRSPVVAWTTVDPKYYRLIRSFPTPIIKAYVTAVCLPLVLCSPDDLWDRYTFWILTETELKIVFKNHEQFFLKNIKQSGDIVKTIPLDSIVACRLEFCKRKPSLPLLQVDTVSAPLKGTPPHTVVGTALIGQDWLAQEILRRRDRLQLRDATKGIIRFSPGATIPVAPGIGNEGLWGSAAPKHGALASFGIKDNAPDGILQWAQECQQHIVAWTSSDPGEHQDAGFYVLFRAVFHILWPLVGFSFSLPMVLYVVVAFSLDHSLLRWLLWIVAAVLIVPYAAAFVQTVSQFRERFIRDNYWVVTETHLCVLSKREGLAVKRELTDHFPMRCCISWSRPSGPMGSILAEDLHTNIQQGRIGK